MTYEITLHNHSPSFRLSGMFKRNGMYVLATLNAQEWKDNFIDIPPMKHLPKPDQADGGPLCYDRRMYCGGMSGRYERENNQTTSAQTHTHTQLCTQFRWAVAPRRKLPWYIILSLFYTGIQGVAGKER